MKWQPITTAPLGQDLELAVIDGGHNYALVFPCRRDVAGRGWIKVDTGERVEVYPTHWREWGKP